MFNCLTQNAALLLQVFFLPSVLLLSFRLCLYFNFTDSIPSFFNFPHLLEPDSFLTICFSSLFLTHRIVYRLEDGKGVDLNATNGLSTTLDFYYQEISVRLLDNGIPLLSCSAECKYALILHNFGQNILRQVGKSCYIRVLKHFILN